MQSVSWVFRDQRGASAAEYAMILAIVGAAIVIAAINLGDSISNSMSAASNQIATCGGAC